VPVFLIRTFDDGGLTNSSTGRSICGCRAFCYHWKEGRLETLQHIYRLWKRKVLCSKRNRISILRSHRLTHPLKK